MLNKMTIQSAEHLATAALLFLAEDEERLGGFLATSGIDPATIREVAAEPAFLAGVLSYLMQDESLLLAFSANRGLPPALIAEAHQTLDPPPELSAQWH
ncbi:MAG: DUF3572 domain-containing protein [Aestuariivirga sp.]